jgi:hypothetical protein
VGCWDATNGRHAASTKCPSSPPLRTEECRDFACGSKIGIGGLQLSLPFRNVNVSVLHQDAFENALTAEIAAAAGMAANTKSVHVISSRSGLGGLATLVRVEIHPGDASVTVDAAVDTLTEQARNPESNMRTQGSFLRRVIDREGALNFVMVEAVTSTDGTSGAVSGPGAQVDAVDPFIDLIATQVAATPSASSGGGSGRMTHGGIAGIAVASSFLGLAVVVAGAWYVMHRTKAGSRFKQARRESKGTSMKIQLTEAEKAEMGMHANPAHAQSKTNAKVQEGVQMIKRAVAQDEARNFTAAINLYQGAVDRFMIAMKFERNATFKFELAKKCDRYLVRIKQLKEYTASNPGGGGAGGGSGLVRAPSVATRSPSLVRAPVV